MRGKEKEARPLYLEMTKDFERKIKSGVYKPGEKLPSVEELCIKLRVHKNTVKSAFKSLRERGLVRNHSGVGIVVREDLRFPLKLALILPKEFCRLENLLSGLNESLKNHDASWVIMFFNTPEEQGEFLRLLKEKDFSGAVITPEFSGSGYSDICKIQNDNFPIVLIDNFYPDSKGLYVDSGAFEAGKAAVKHLKKIGRTPIALVCRNDKLSERFIEGYQKAHLGLRLDCRRNNIRRLEAGASAGEASLELMKLKNPPCSIVYTNPGDAAIGYKGLKDAGKDLKSIRLVSFGEVSNNDLLEHPIFCMQRDFKELGEKAGRLLIKGIESSAESS
jgi:DNA-binding LacI/PurR family transcriptional regulator